MIARGFIAVVVGLVVACAGPYKERPPSSAEGEAPRPAAESGTRDPEAGEREAPGTTEIDADGADATEEVLVGHVTPDGRFHAATGSSAADPIPVERETVV
ncbi:MAG: hypothetical protein ACREK5_05670, partial [Gemmatimonadota bacterium]